MEKNILPYIFRYLAITKIKKLSYIFLIICFIPSMFWQANAQTFNANTCGTEKQMEIMYKHNADALLESNILRKKISTLKKSKAEPYVIPVVFHVFGTEFNGDTTVTIDIVKDALRRTNEDFQGLNDDYTTIDAPFDAIKQPLDITFKLAQLDPNGNPTTGVLFYNEASGMGHYSSPMVPRVAWDNLKYCNIYITRDLYGDGTHNNSGVAWYPNTGMTNENIARIVYNGSYLASNTDENFRSVLTHEFGHYLDLPHTFDKSVCSDDPEEGDGVADTPSHKKNSSQTACAVIHNCLQQEINNENFMDYTDCYKMFTQGQVERMNNALQNSPARNTLWTNANIQATGLSSDLGPRIVASSIVLEERYPNDGLIEDTIDLTCIGCTFSNSSGDLILNTDYTVTNLPEGVTPRIQITSNTTATIHLENAASNHNLENSISNLTFTFLNPMIAGGVSQLYKSGLDNLKINFNDEYTEACDSNFRFAIYSHITNVEFDGRTNPTGYGKIDIYTPGPFSAPDFTKIAIYPVKKGESYPITITTNKGNGGFTDNIRIQGWFDWNNNFILEDDELIISHVYNNRFADEHGNYTYTTNIEVPTSANLGNTIFRILAHFVMGNEGDKSCSTVDSGESEDYTLKIIDENTPFSMDFYTNSTTVNLSQEVAFSDITITDFGDVITSYQWTFEGGQPASSTDRSPTGIIFPEEGFYDISLEITTANGTNRTITKRDYITSILKYCEIDGRFGGYFDVNRVAIGTIDHVPAHSRPRSYYDSISTTLIVGNTYPITIKTQRGNGGTTDVNRVRVWADWNFDSAWSQDEMIVSQEVNDADYTNDEYEFTTDITVPTNAKVGKKIGLRVVGHFVDGKGGETSCGKYDSGNTADYGILISNPMYCTASNQNDFVYITRVRFGEVDNSSAHNPYSDYTEVSSTVLAGNQFTLTVETNKDHLAKNILAAWIDWNNDGVFDDDTEKVLRASKAGPYSSEITVPESAVFNVALRLRVRLGNNLDQITSCGEDRFGEVEDYSIFTAGDTDVDGVSDNDDKCNNTPSGESVNESGCSESQVDTDNDGVFDNVDTCPNTPSNEPVNTSGCLLSETDTDGDSIFDDIDQCSNTPSGESVNENGCSESQIDIDNDGVFDNVDTCLNTPSSESVNESGCSESQVDTDNDGVFDNIDQCNNTTSGDNVNAIGCTQVSSNNFEISSTTPSCPNINNGKISIKNVSSHMFNFVVTGPNSYNKTFENKLANEPFVIENLAVGMYNITAKFSTDGIGKDIPGFQVAVNGATPVSGTNKSVNQLGKSSVFTVSGDKKYSIYVNDVFQRDETFSDESEYDIVVENLSTGKNHIKIIPENICRGLIENWIIIPNGDIKFYPNPAGDLFHIAGLESSDINVQVFAPDGQQVYNKNHKPVNGVVYFSTRDLSAGFYIVRVSGDKSGDIINFKMTKK